MRKKAWLEQGTGQGSWEGEEQHWVQARVSHSPVSGLPHLGAPSRESSSFSLCLTVSWGPPAGHPMRSRDEGPCASPPALTAPTQREGSLHTCSSKLGPDTTLSILRNVGQVNEEIEAE